MATVINPGVADVPVAGEVYEYLTGFGNEHESEALAGALPQGRFSPQKVAYGLYAEKLSSTAFTAPRETNRRTWFYRIRPSVTHGDFRPVEQSRIVQRSCHRCSAAAQPDALGPHPHTGHIR